MFLAYLKKLIVILEKDGLVRPQKSLGLGLLNIIESEFKYLKDNNSCNA